MKNNERNKRIATILTIFTIIFTIMGGSLAYWTWQTDIKTNIAFSIGADFSCSADGGGNITGANLEPTADCTKGISTTVVVTPTIEKPDLTINMNLWLKVNSIAPELSRSENLKYVITTIPNNCTQGIVGKGDFHGLASESTTELFSNKQYTGTGNLSETYYLYIWLDAAETDNLTQGKGFNFSLGGECTDKKGNSLSNHIMQLASKSGSGVYHEEKNEQIAKYTVIPATESSWSSITTDPEVELQGDGERWSFNCLEYGYNEDFEEELCVNLSASANLVPKKAGYYKFDCNGGNSYMEILLDDEFVGACELGDTMGTTELGYLTSNNIITISESIADYDFAYVGDVKFYYNSGINETITYDAGYRYQGETVDNYITFNDETWRIIGVQEGSTIGLDSGKYYTKIIKADTLVMTDKEINNILNNQYFNNQPYSYEKCDYAEEYCYTKPVVTENTGIKNEYRGLIANAKRYKLGFDMDKDISEIGLVTTPIDTFIKEKESTSNKFNVSLMEPSDYGLSTSQSECKNRNLANFSDCKTWLKNGGEWLLSDNESGDGEFFKYHITSTGNVEYIIPNYDDNSIPEYATRPTLYLNSDVQLTGGSGKIGDQYKIS